MVMPPGGRRTEKQPTGRPVAPEGGVENGPAGETYRRVGVSAFAEYHQLLRDLLVIIAVSKSSLNFPRPQYDDTLPSRPVYSCPKDNVRKILNEWSFE